MTHPKVFEIADDDQRLVTLYKAGHPQEYAATVEKVGKQIWKQIIEDGAYIDVSDGRGILIPADRILEIEVRRGWGPTPERSHLDDAAPEQLLVAAISFLGSLFQPPHWLTDIHGDLPFELL